MAPKGHRAAPAAPRHSRSTSATKLPINLAFTQKKAPPRPKQPQQPQQPVKQRGGFHIASPGDEDDEEDEAWVSSESGQVTPNPHNEDDSDLDSAESNDQLPQLKRVAAARPSDYKVDQQRRPATAQQTRVPLELQVEPQRRQPSREPSRISTESSREPSRSSRTESNGNNGVAGNVSRISTESNAPLTPTRRHTARPMSSHSMNRPELRLHPLIRGQSYGQPSPKPSPLLPVAVTADVAQLTASPSTSPTSPFLPNLARRSSISSARSVATVATSHPAPPPRSIREPRHRTLSAAPSSAALSSLAHLPAVSRPPSPQMIAFFPPVNPHARTDDIHPLLPPPYVSNHLTVLARRTPIREAFDRVVRARQSVRS
ncbi:hypothetical protein C8R45DRAFT_984474 [Mycena sanguinolenta]|nr:hypothetical protein C8R45DRAFT_984474 [Mycena sanguinolenta]